MNVFHDLALGRIANWLTALASAVLLIFHVTYVAKLEPTIDTSNMDLVFADEFDGDALNTSVWGSHYSEGIRKGGYWTMDQASVKDSRLTIRTEYKEDGKFGAGWYSCGMDTNGRYGKKYGYFECRAILPRGVGMWSAFWLFNSNVNKINGHGREGTEIDVFESPYSFLPGKMANRVTSNLHFNGYELQTRYRNVAISKLDNDPYENFNKYGLLWTPEEYVFYVNDREVGRSSYGGVSQEPEFMILSCEVVGAAGIPTYGWSGRIDRNGPGFTADFIVDYVRVYELPGQAGGTK